MELYQQHAEGGSCSFLGDVMLFTLSNIELAFSRYSPLPIHII